MPDGEVGVSKMDKWGGAFGEMMLRVGRTLLTKPTGAVLGLDPRTTVRLCRVENGPRIKSEGSNGGWEKKATMS